jgi:NAD+ synthase
LHNILAVPKLDSVSVVSKIIGFIKKTVVDKSRADGVVIGLSGGVDSAVVTALCIRALGKERVLAVLMPTAFTPIADITDANNLAINLGIETRKVDIESIRQSFITTLDTNTHDPAVRIPLANITARIRMIVLYWFANSGNKLVAGTGDKSEISVGYFTKYGDGGADFFPIAHLYKTQVRDLSKYLGIPDHITYKPSSPQLYPGHKVTDELPVDYHVLDRILLGLFKSKLSKEEVAKRLGVEVEIVTQVETIHHSTIHKRKYPENLSNRQ